MVEQVINPKDFSKEEIARGLELLMREKDRKERIARGEIKGHVSWAEMTEEQKQARRDYNKKKRIHDQLLMAKAEAAGIEVTPAELEKALKA